MCLFFQSSNFPCHHLWMQVEKEEDANSWSQWLWDRLKVVCGGGVDCRIKAPETDLSPFLPAGTTVVSLLQFVWQIMSPASWWKISKVAATALLKFIINCRRSVTCEHHHTEETTVAEKSLNSNLSFKPATAKPKPMNTGKSSSKRACKGGQR